MTLYNALHNYRDKFDDMKRLKQTTSIMEEFDEVSKNKEIFQSKLEETFKDRQITINDIYFECSNQFSDHLTWTIKKTIFSPKDDQQTVENIIKHKVYNFNLDMQFLRDYLINEEYIIPDSSNRGLKMRQV